jgi:hypothetical protein
LAAASLHCIRQVLSALRQTKGSRCEYTAHTRPKKNQNSLLTLQELEALGVDEVAQTSVIQVVPNSSEPDAKELHNGTLKT